ncbi:MAG: HD domain-containing protein [Oscillospiraceae bacterium]|nr:HD domain-containing protein [Oscillospiraceae bacterium]MDD4413834.1 HD domain-containing protein [Oscillospiraceae bacterium]
MAYLSYRLAQRMDMPEKARRNILLQGLLHDIGALSLDERLSLLEEEPIKNGSHAFRGGTLLSGCIPLQELAEGVRYHHLPWNNGQGLFFRNIPVPIESHILHLADRVCASFSNTSNILADIGDVLSKIKLQENLNFSPEIMSVLFELESKEHIWLEFADSAPLRHLPESAIDNSKLDLDGVLSIAKVFSHIIDFRSHFTATHSAGVARIAEKLAEQAGMTVEERKMIIIAGCLHDLGKLGVQGSILEKPGKLDYREFSAIRAHTFYTYKLLNMIGGFSTINQWASFHHERLDGTGYPFHMKAEQLTLGSRIMTVSDIFNAITENRPYRKGMGKNEIVEVIKDMSDNGKICSDVAHILLADIDFYISLSKATQKLAADDYDRFFRDDDKIAI